MRISNMGLFSMKMRHWQDNKDPFVIKVRITMDHGITLVMFLEETKDLPSYRIHNHMPFAIHVKQDLDRSSVVWEVVPPKSSHIWAWDYPEEKHYLKMRFYKVMMSVFFCIFSWCLAYGLSSAWCV